MVKVTARLTESNGNAHCIICGRKIPHGEKKITVSGYQMSKSIGPECIHKFDMEINPIMAVQQKLFELALSKVNAMYKEKTGNEVFTGDMTKTYSEMSVDEIASMILREYRDIYVTA